MALEIITNNVPRSILSFWELTDKEQEEYDFCDQFANFFRYKGEAYYLGDFMRIDNLPELAKWDGYHSDSFFSGIVVKYVDDDAVIVGRYLS